MEKIFSLCISVKEKLMEKQKSKNQEVPDDAFLDMLMRCQVDKIVFLR